MRIDHVAIAVEDLESAVKQYVDAFGITDMNMRLNLKKSQWPYLYLAS